MFGAFSKHDGIRCFMSAWNLDCRQLILVNPGVFGRSKFCLGVNTGGKSEGEEEEEGEVEEERAEEKGVEEKERAEGDEADTCFCLWSLVLAENENFDDRCVANIN